MLKIFILTLIFAFASPIYGNDSFDDIIQEILPTSKFTTDQLKNLKKELGIQKLFIEGVQSIEMRGGRFVDIERSTSTIHDLLVSSMNAKSSSLGAEAQAKIVEMTKGGFNRSTVKTVLLKTRDFANNLVKGKKVFAGSLMRRYGFDVGIVTFLAAQIDYTFPWYMMSHGHPEFGVLALLPITSSATGAYVAAKSAIKYRHVVKKLGGLKVALKHFNIQREVRKFFNQKVLKSYNLFDIYTKSKTYVITADKRNLINRFMQKAGWNNSLNYENLLKHMDDNNILPKVIERVSRSDKHPTHKLLKLIHAAEQSTNINDFHSIRERFGKYIKEVNTLPEFSPQRKWVMKIMDSRSMDHFMQLLGQMPDDIPPSIFDKIWRGKVLTGTSKTITNFLSKEQYKAFRSLVNNYDDILRADFTKSTATAFSSSQRQLFSDYIYKSLANMGICQQIFKIRTQKSIPFL
jgi:hypothetical protein